MMIPATSAVAEAKKSTPSPGCDDGVLKIVIHRYLTRYFECQTNRNASATFVGNHERGLCERCASQNRRWPVG